LELLNPQEKSSVERELAVAMARPVARALQARALVERKHARDVLATDNAMLREREVKADENLAKATRKRAESNKRVDDADQQLRKCQAKLAKRETVYSNEENKLNDSDDEIAGQARGTLGNFKRYCDVRDPRRPPAPPSLPTMTASPITSTVSSIPLSLSIYRSKGRQSLMLGSH
jgi:hypothetical protein